jgi:outer membrane protein assembly factor BamD
MTPNLKLFARAALVAALTVGCAMAATRKGDAPQDYYEQGLQDMKNELWVEAASAFATLKAKFPYSKFAALAELRLADVKYGSEKYLEAIDAYRLFIQYHPTHEEVPHATFQEAQAHYKEIPEDFFFLPPAHEKDQVEVEKAARAFKEYIERFPEGAKIEEAKKRLGDCYLRLAQHDLYVARFYKREEKWRGAAGRYESLRTYITGTSLEPTVLLELGSTYVKLKDGEKVRATFARLLEAYPESDEAKEAKKQLKDLPASAPASSPAQ